MKMKNKGFTLFIAMIVIGTLLLIAAGIVGLAVRQSLISSSGRESQEAFYAADSGIECVLYWDIQNPNGVSAFSTSTGSTIFCNRDAANPANQWTVGGSYVSQFTMTFIPDTYCAVVTVTKGLDGSTHVESLGYNDGCGLTTTSRRVERAIRAIY